MLIITMTKTVPASRDGLTVEDFLDGKTYEMRTAHEQRVARSLVSSGWAFEGKAMTAPENKAAPMPRQDDVSPGEQAGTAAPASDFDPTAAPIEAVRAFLAERGAKPHHKTGEAKLREMALEIVTGG